MPSQETFDALAQFAVRTFFGSNHVSTVLHLVAAKENNPELVAMFLNEGIDVNSQNSDGSTALHAAANQGYLEVCQELVSAGANYTIIDNYGNTALHMATKHQYYTPLRNLEVVKFLASLPNAPLNELDCNGGTPLHNVLMYNNEEVAAVLLQAGADPNAHNMNSDPAFFSCLSHKGRNCVKSALHYGADVNAVGRGEFTALHAAAAHDVPTIINILLDAGSNPRSLNGYKQMPIHLAAQRQSKKAIRQLLIFDSTLATALDAEGNTPLHYAAKNWLGDSILRLLVEKYNVDVNPRNNAGQTPFTVATHEFTKNYLKSVGGVK